MIFHDLSRDLFDRSWFWPEEFPQLPPGEELILAEESTLVGQPTKYRRYRRVELVLKIPGEVGYRAFTILGIMASPHEAQAAKREVRFVCIMKALCQRQLEKQKVIKALGQPIFEDLKDG